MIPIGTIRCETCEEEIVLTINNLLESSNYCESCYSTTVSELNNG